nr:hypothetical protein [Tanacetum cinerariifolium]
MPELFEIDAFASMIQAGLSDTQRPFTLSVYPMQGGKNTFIDLDMAKEMLGSEMEVSIAKADVVAYGKELLIRLNPSMVIICHFALHGHAVTLSPDELELVDVCRDQGLPPFMPLIFRAKDRGNSMGIIDRNKIARLTFTVLPEGQSFQQFRSSGRGPCPIRDIALFEDGVRALSSKGHVRRNHGPIAHFIYSQLLEGWTSLLMVFRSDQYHEQVIRSAERAGREGTAFHHPLGPTVYRKKITRVYRKTGSSGMAAVPINLVHIMLANGQITNIPISPSRV